MRLNQCTLDIKKDKNGDMIVSYWDSFERDHKIGQIQRDELLEKTIERFSYWATNHEDVCTRDDLQTLGLHLYHMLFDEEVSAALLKAREKVEEKKDSDNYFRVKLIFHKEAEDLALYPWEFIFMPSESNGIEGNFLAKTTELILSRIVPNLEIQEKLTPGERPVRILIVSSHPKNRSIIDATDFVKKMENLESENLKIEYVKNPSYEKLKKDLESGQLKQPHIFHFIGHGEPGKVIFKKDREKIIFEAENKNIDEEDVDDENLVDGQTLSALFGYSKPCLVFLNSCSGAKSEYRQFNKKTNSFANELIKEKIPSVIAMQFEISNNDAFTFASKVYEEISEGEPIDRAVKHGVYELGSYQPSWNHPRFGNPVFYLQADDAKFLSKLSSQPRPKEIDSHSNNPIWDKCPYGCHNQIRSDWQICNNCGNPIMKCPHCKRIIVPGNYCSECQKPLRSISDQAEAATSPKEKKVESSSQFTISSNTLKRGKTAKGNDSFTP